MKMKLLKKKLESLDEDKLFALVKACNVFTTDELVGLLYDTVDHYILAEQMEALSEKERSI